MRAIALCGVLLVLAGCGGSSGEADGGFYTAASIRSCLVASGARVLLNSRDYVDGDASGGTFHVEVDRSYATAAFAATDTGAAETARRALRELRALGKTGDLARQRGNVAYWLLDASDAPMRAIEACLKETPSEEEPVGTTL